MTTADLTGLIGRDDSLQTLDSYLDTVAEPGGALLVIGEAGIGKTALVRAAAAQAAQAGLCVIGAHGGEFQASTSFAALRQLLAPLRSHIDLLTPAHQGALVTALGDRAKPGVRPPPARGTLGSAVLALLRVAATEGPLLVVDDAQWLDPASGEVLAFVARRLIGTRAGLLAVIRPGFAGALEEVDLPQHRLSPLSEEHARALLDDRFPHLAAPVRDPRVRALPDNTRELLLLAALEGSGDLSTLARGTAGVDVLAAVTPAEHSGLVRVEDNTSRLTFRHPLVTTTLIELATPAQRQHAHARIAAALADYPDRRAWHLAAAAPGPDESIALLLEEQSRVCLGRGDALDAAQLLQRATELSPTPQSQARRQVQAAFIGADVTGDLHGAAQLIADADRVEPTLTQSLLATVAATYLLLNAECEIDTAHRLLTDSIDAHPGRHDATDPVLEEGLHSLLIMSWFGGRRSLWSPFLRAVGRVGPGVPPLVDLVHRTFGDPVHQGRDALPALADVLRRIDSERDPLRISRIGLACVYTDRIGECRQALRRVVDSGREGGAVALAINALLSSCVDDWLTGQWDEAVDLAAEGVRLCQRHGYRRYSVILGGYIDQLVRVARGDLEGGRAAADEMAQWAADRGAGASRLFAEHLYTLRAAALGDFAAAYHHATQISPAGRLAEYNPHALWVLFDLVEAATRTNRRAEATAHVIAMRKHRIGQLSPRLRMLLDGCTALVCNGAEATLLFERALAVPEGPRWPFDRARIQLAYGDHLHHGKDPAARTVLAEATAAFHRLGAEPWEARAAAALRASGASVQDRRGTAPDPAGAVLTAREQQIAALAARGLSNRQIGEQLFLSPRSVGAALYRVFPKLGITSRAALAAALTAHERQTAARDPAREPNRS
jgi:DNA-binding CsgD family transcriptional regulator